MGAWVRLVLLGLTASLLSLTGAVAQLLPAEDIQLPSTNFSDQEFLAGTATAGEPVVLGGRLILPDSKGPHPLIIALHGSDGANGSAAEWPSVIMRAIVKAGYGALTIDSFGGRGFAEIATDQDRVTQFAQIYDA